LSERIALLLDLETEHAAALSGWCGRHGVSVRESDADLAPSLDRRDIAVVVVGLSGEPNAALERIRTVAKSARGAPVVVLARSLSGELAFRCARLGVADVIELPAPTLDVVARVALHVRTTGTSPELAALVGQSEAMQRLRREVREAGRVESKLLLQGETGSGKGMVARLVHDLSSRRLEPFIHVDCAALSPTLIESELFGHEKHAFTGAGGLRRGRFEAAGMGTIFLDEIGDLDGALQSKLLRVLEDRMFERVGGTQSLPMTARVIAATCHDLARRVEEGRFRPDLYFRLNVISISVPPLRDRLEDVPELARAAVQRVAETLGVAMPTLSDSFYARLREYRWPGNVRELINVIERLLVRGPMGCLEAEDLDGMLNGPGARPEPPPTSPARPIQTDHRTAASAPDLSPAESADRERIVAALEATGGNVSRVCRRLEMPRGTVRHRIRKYQLEHLIQKD
jgi:DNA-binding NtrC family response regulator